MKIAKRLACALTLFVTLTAAFPASAQRLDGDLSGEVKDPGGLMVAKAKVTIINEGTAGRRELETTQGGTFFAANLLPGVYTVEVGATGFKKAVKPGIAVAADRLAQVSIMLELGASSETITVEAGAQMVDTQTPTLNNTYGELQLHSPIMGQGGSITGDPLGLALLAPGTTSQPGGVAGTGGSIGGNRPRSNSFTVDGLDNNDSSVTGQFSPVIAESVKEFTLITNQFSAEYGHSTAGQFIVTTKSGANDLHGEAWWYNQNRHFNSLDNLNAFASKGQDAPRFDANRLGAQAGGRVIRDKWFYFGAYEFQNLGQAGTSSSGISVPTQAGLAALQALAATPGSGVSPVNVKILSDHVPVASVASGSPVSVCNELINSTCASNGAFVPIPIGQFNGTTPQFIAAHLFLISQDFQFGKHKISGRFQYSKDRRITAGALPVAEFNSSRVFDTRRMTWSDAWAVNNRLVNEFRLGYLHVIGPNQPLGAIPAPAGTDAYGNYSIKGLSLNIGPDSSFPQASAGNTYQAADNITYVHGKHTLKTGVDVRDIIRGGGFLPRARGDYSWAPSALGSTAGSRSLSGLDGFVRDMFANDVAIRGVGSGFFSQNHTAAYTFIQDSWRIFPRFTLELGLRYEFTQPARDNALQNLNGLANVGSITGETYTPALLVRLRQCASVATCANPLLGTKIFDSLPAAQQDAITKYIIPVVGGDQITFRPPHADADGFAPRIGIAWDIFGDGKTSLRAGVGRGYDVLFGNLALLQLPPQLQAENRETNACSLSPSPAWCANTVGGNPVDRNNPPNIHFKSTGFLASGGLLPVLPLTTRTDPYVARAATGNFVMDEKLPEVWTWSLSLQHQFGSSWLVEGRYVGTHGLHLPEQTQLNTGIPAYFDTPAIQLPVFTSRSAVPTSFSSSSPTLAKFNSAIASKFGGRMLSAYGFGGALTEYGQAGTSIYHGASIRVERRFSKGLLFQSNYTFSKTMDDAENELFSSVVNPRRRFNQTQAHGSRGLSGLDRRQKFVLSWVYDLPRFGGSNALARGFLNGWSWAGAYIAESGQPVTIFAAGVDVNGDLDTAGDFAFHNPSGTHNVGSGSHAVCMAGAVVTDNPMKCNDPTQNSGIFGYLSDVDNAEWIIPGPGGVANGGRGNHIVGFINNWDMAIQKRTPVWGESRFLEFKAEAVNVFNHPSFTIGSGSSFGGAAFSGAASPAATNSGYVIPGSPNFLQDSSFSGGLGQSPFQRVIQFSLRYIF